jgi:hypothetical protein
MITLLPMTHEFQDYLGASAVSQQTADRIPTFWISP